jgi:ribosomal 30S subunit maturation factor RimM
VQPAAGVNGGRESLLPAIADVVESVDLSAGVMVIRLLDGLIDM